ncbi:MAG: cytochrome B6, partial [Roseimicrobium sp.]
MKIPPAPLRRAALLAVLTASSLVSSPSFADGDFDAMVKKLQAAKPEFAKRQQDLLKERYDFADKPVEGLTMPRGKPVQGGVRVKLPKDMTWDKLAEMTPDDIKAKDLWPAGLYPLP